MIYPINKLHTVVVQIYFNLFPSFPHPPFSSNEARFTTLIKRDCHSNEGPTQRSLCEENT